MQQGRNLQNEEFEQAGNVGSVKKTWWDRLAHYLGIASDLAQMVMSLRDKPRLLDWMSLAIRMTHIVNKVREDRRLLRIKPAYCAFIGNVGLKEGERWATVRHEFRELVKAHVRDLQPIDSYWDGNKDSSRPFIGYIGSERVGLIKRGTMLTDIYMVSSREEETYVELGNRMWEAMGSDHISYSNIGYCSFIRDELDLGRFVPTDQLIAIRDRLKAFLDAGINRSMLFQGVPGCGKSLGVQYLVREFGARSMRVDMVELERSLGFDMDFLNSMMRILKPDAIILDDLDRVDMGARLLPFLENAARCCRMVLITSNCEDRMLGATLRPGRVDDIVYFEELDRRVMLQLVDNDEELADALRGLPIAYIVEYAKREEILGRAQAMLELPELRARAISIEEKTIEESNLQPLPDTYIGKDDARQKIDYNRFKLSRSNGILVLEDKEE